MFPQRQNRNPNAKDKEDAYAAMLVTARRINTAGVGLLVVTAVCASLFFVYPAIVKSQKIKAELSRTEQELKAKLEYEGQLEALIEKYRSDLRIAEGMLFSDRDIATFLKNFSDFAKSANVSLISIRSLNIAPVPVASESEKTLQEIENKKRKKKEDEAGQQKKMGDELPGLLMKPMEVRIEGAYSDLIKFLISLEEYKQLLNINNLDIRIAKQGYPVLEASFIIRLYKMESPEKTAGKGA